MTVPDQTSFCWPLDTSCLDASWDDLDPAIQARATAQAQSALYRLCAGRVGGCPLTVRPCSQRGCEGLPLGYEYNAWAGGWMYPFMRADGSVFNCCGAPRCGCITACEVEPGGFIGTISEIKIDGTPQDLADFSTADHESIVYLGSGDCPFPKFQNMALPDTEPGTFSITYLPAWDVDGEGAFACALLAFEFAKACNGDKKCRLPTNVTSLVRQGVSYNIISGVFPGGRTGIFEVDSYIGRYNPAGLMDEPAVWTPTMPKSRTFT